MSQAPQIFVNKNSIHSKTSVIWDMWARITNINPTPKEAAINHIYEMVYSEEKFDVLRFEGLPIILTWIEDKTQSKAFRKLLDELEIEYQILEQ